MEGGGETLIYVQNYVRLCETILTTFAKSRLRTVSRLKVVGWKGELYRQSRSSSVGLMNDKSIT